MTVSDRWITQTNNNVNWLDEISVLSDSDLKWFIDHLEDNTYQYEDVSHVLHICYNNRDLKINLILHSIDSQG